jgi:hypothetical protein
MVMLVSEVQDWKASSDINFTDASNKVLGSATDPEEDEPSIKYAVFPEALIMYFIELVSSVKESNVF